MLRRSRRVNRTTKTHDAVRLTRPTRFQPNEIFEPGGLLDIRVNCAVSFKLRYRTVTTLLPRGSGKENPTRQAGSRGGSSRVAQNPVAQKSFSRRRRHVQRKGRFHSTIARISAAATVAAGLALPGAAARRRLRIGSAG